MIDKLSFSINICMPGIGHRDEHERGRNTQIYTQIIATQCDEEWRLKNTKSAAGTHSRDTGVSGIDRELTPFI